jgi:hypothetical protein
MKIKTMTAIAYVYLWSAWDELKRRARQWRNTP